MISVDPPCSIAAVGECMIELSENDNAWRMNFAGDTFNTLWVLRALCSDRAATYVSAFGDDVFSRNQIAFFMRNGIGIGTSPIIYGTNPGVYAISLTGSERSFTYWRSDSAARQLASDSAALSKNLQNQSLIYFSGITLAILNEDARKILLTAIADARAAGSLIAFDPNYRPSIWDSVRTAQAAIAQALMVVDIVLPTFADEQALFSDGSPEVTANRLGQDVAEVVVKNGEEQALVSVRGDLQPVPAIHVAKPIDTTGAGDSFNGAYLASRLAGFEALESTRRAHRVAAAVVQVHGALASFELLREAFGT